MHKTLFCYVLKLFLLTLFINCKLKAKTFLFCFIPLNNQCKRHKSSDHYYIYYLYRYIYYIALLLHSITLVNSLDRSIEKYGSVSCFNLLADFFF